MSKNDLEHAVAAASAALSIHVPISVYLAEATNVAGFAVKYWDAVKEGKDVRLPGLSSVAHKKTAGYAISAHTADEIKTLVAQAQAAQTELRLAQNPKVSRADLERAAIVLSDIEAALEFLFDDGKEDANDAKLAAVEQSHAHDSTIDEEAQALDDFAALAKAHRKELDGLGDFDVALIDEAGELADKLRARAEQRAPSAEATAAMEQRNRLLDTIATRVDALRTAARFVFRRHPEVRRQATSAYERRTRAARRRAKAAKTARATPANA